MKTIPRSCHRCLLFLLVKLDNQVKKKNREVIPEWDVLVSATQEASAEAAAMQDAEGGDRCRRAIG